MRVDTKPLDELKKEQVRLASRVSQLSAEVFNLKAQLIVLREIIEDSEHRKL